jgi:hypothetical protein
MMMYRKIATLFTLVALVGGCDATPQGIAEATDTNASAPAFSRGPSAKPMVLRLLGSADKTDETVPDPNNLIPGNDDAFCYTIPMIDVTIDREVGTAKDCISVLGLANGGVQVVGTTTFDFGGGHTFTTQGLTSVQPTTHGSPGITDITGAIPTAGSNGVIAGTGRFAKFAATARLSGAVNLSAFPATAAFDCLFVVERL